MQKVFVYGSLCNPSQLKSVLGRVPTYTVTTLPNFRRDNTATWEFYPNSTEDKKFYTYNSKFVDFHPSFLTLVPDANHSTIGITIEVTESELAMLDDREGLLEPIPYYAREVHTTTNGEPVHVYIAINTTILSTSKCPSEYLDACNKIVDSLVNVELNYLKHQALFSLPTQTTDGIYNLSDE